MQEIKIVQKSSVLSYVRWDITDIAEIEELLKKMYPHIDCSFEYRTGSGWSFRYGPNFKTMKEDDIIIVGYREPVIMLYQEMGEKYITLTYSQVQELSNDEKG